MAIRDAEVDPTIALTTRESPLDLPPEDFRALGHALIDRVADFLASLRERRVAPHTSPEELRALLEPDQLPEEGADPEQLLRAASDLLFENSLFNGHPAYLGYIQSSAAPIGALADLLAAAVNPNVGAWTLSPIATEIEQQTVRWIAELVGFPRQCGGLLVSGGNMANMVCFLAARTARGGTAIRTQGLASDSGRRLTFYTSTETHTWIQKAADLFGFGTDAIRWIPTDASQRLDTVALVRRIEEDERMGLVPFLVVGTGGSVSTGAIDPLREIARIARERNIWFHVDGAYGAPAAALPDAPDDLKALSLADSVAVDPHKWLYAPLEVGCVLVRDPATLRAAFAYAPPYYSVQHAEGDDRINFHEHGPQNSRGFRALKVWLALRQAGRAGYVRMISDDIALARALHDLVSDHPELEAVTQGLSITTFRYVPSDLTPGSGKIESYLNDLNAEVLVQLLASREVYLTNALVGGKFVLRPCIVNFRTTLATIQAIPDLVVRFGRDADRAMRPASVRGNE